MTEQEVKKRIDHILTNAVFEFMDELGLSMDEALDAVDEWVNGCPREESQK